ncbi:MAG: ATP-binding protein [Gemmatimonadaceae bacterium]
MTPIVFPQSPIERGEITVDVSDTDVVAVAARVVEQYRSRAAAKGLRLFAILPESAPTIPLNAARFEQVLRHLVDNAVKFTGKGSIKVTLVTEADTKRPSRLIIADTGIGIPADRLDQIFMSFEQVEGSSRHSGVGLGLTLALGLCDAMGCRLTAASEIGVGSRFTVRFR